MSDYPSGDRLTQLNMAVSLMANTAWKNTVAPAHDHTMGGEQAMVHERDGRQVFAKMHNCPRCGELASERLWPLALEEAWHRMTNGLPGPGGLMHPMSEAS